MSEAAIPKVQGSSAGGLAGALKGVPDGTFSVAPTVATDRNQLTTGLIPIACWRVDDIRFDFDSSFVLPDLADEMVLLGQLRTEHSLLIPGSEPPDSLPPPISIFGHADPVGDDAYNKQLSGRRATAIYALLIRDTALWEELYSKPLGGDNWAPRALRTMLVTVDPSLETDSARLQRETGKAQSNAGTRKALFASYMDKLGGGVKLQKDDFLGGTDKDGKADYQGCSEFNPVLLFSAQEDEEFKKAENKKKRNAENAQNRRVIALLFRPGSKVDPAKWPCPRAKEGTAGCIKRFWSDGESRRGTRLPGKRRRFEETEDTFACRFYHRISSTSPCEKLDALIDIQLLYEDKEPMAEADFEAVFDKVSVTGKTDKNGRATILRPDDAPPEFLLFLNAFPEKYADVPVEPVNTANPRVAQNDSASRGGGHGRPRRPPVLLAP